MVFCGDWTISDSGSVSLKEELLPPLQEVLKGTRTGAGGGAGGGVVPANLSLRARPRNLGMCRAWVFHPPSPAPSFWAGDWQLSLMERAKARLERQGTRSRFPGPLGCAAFCSCSGNCKRGPVLPGRCWTLEETGVRPWERMLAGLPAVATNKQRKKSGEHGEQCPEQSCGGHRSKQAATGSH